MVPLHCWGFLSSGYSILIIGFALIHWGGNTLDDQVGANFFQCLYYSGETFFTLGYGDITAVTLPGKLFSVVEAGTGFGFIAVSIGYLPVLYQAFSRRELNIALLDARAGSPPTAAELWRREGTAHTGAIDRFLIEWEVWAAELLESHLSFPILSYYRSQHDNQSWLAALTLVLDASAFLLVSGKAECRQRAKLTFAMARHACVDLCLVFWLPPVQPPNERVTDSQLSDLISPDGTALVLSAEQIQKLRELRSVYEPFLQALANYFSFRIPDFFPDRPSPDNWQTSPWTKRVPGIIELPTDATASNRHFGI